MADLYPTPTRLALLRDIRDGKVRDDNDSTPMLHFDENGQPYSARVASTVWAMRRAGWCRPTDAAAWELTDAGRAILTLADAGVELGSGSANEPEAVIGPGEGLLT